MGSTVGMKARKKQPATSRPAAVDVSFERALMKLEDVCLAIKDGQFTHGKEDIDRLYWQQKLKNIVMPISLAMAEYKGPRVFHQHYKHREDDDTVLVPVLESSRDNLVRVCARSVVECEKLNGMKGSKLLDEKSLLERSLRQFLAAAA
ncbi:MAG: hypothetical protein SFX19_06870 [Alphaproteobacteria bacterium]|nr:hypothetical protein [Alphaproteobacteria bacterium]